MLLIAHAVALAAEMPPIIANMAFSFVIGISDSFRNRTDDWGCAVGRQAIEVYATSKCFSFI